MLQQIIYNIHLQALRASANFHINYFSLEKKEIPTKRNLKFPNFHLQDSQTFHLSLKKKKKKAE